MPITKVLEIIDENLSRKTQKWKFFSRIKEISNTFITLNFVN